MRHRHDATRHDHQRAARQIPAERRPRWWSRFGARRRTDAADNVLIADVESFLSGTLVETTAARGAIVPAWAWMNVLAHGDPEAIQRVSGEPAGSARDVWRAARSYLAGETMLVAARCGSLMDLQRRVLAPIELDFAARPVTPLPRPNEWVVVVLRALNDFERARIRSLRNSAGSVLDGRSSCRDLRPW